MRARAYTWDASARALGRIYDEAIARRTATQTPRRASLA
jgi:hypothetical protein